VSPDPTRSDLLTAAVGLLVALLVGLTVWVGLSPSAAPDQGAPAGSRPWAVTGP
jgi:hypothetical protein